MELNVLNDVVLETDTAAAGVDVSSHAACMAGALKTNEAVFKEGASSDQG